MRYWTLSYASYAEPLGRDGELVYTGRPTYLGTFLVGMLPGGRGTSWMNSSANYLECITSPAGHQKIQTTLLSRRPPDAFGRKDDIWHGIASGERTAGATRPSV